MQIKAIRMKNWKCFTLETFEFNKLNIINRPNGTGKTSMFEAILFCLYGKRPTGFNFTTMRNNPKSACVVTTVFEYYNPKIMEHCEVFVEREFGGKNGSTCIAKIRKSKESDSVLKGWESCQTIGTSHNDVVEFIEKLAIHDIIDVFWSPNTLTGSSILKPNFLVDTIFEHIFNDPKTLLKYYKKETFTQSKIVSNLENKNYDDEDTKNKIRSINKEINKIRESIVEKINKVDESLADAHSAKKASEFLDEFNKANEGIKLPEKVNLLNTPSIDKYISPLMVEETISSRVASLLSDNPSNKIDFKLFDDIRIRFTNKINEVISKVESDIEREESKIKSDILDKISKSTLKTIKELGEENDKCPICDKKWNGKTSKKLEKVIDSGTYNVDFVVSSLKDIEILKEYSNHYINNRITNSIESLIKSYKSKVDRCPNFDEVIESYKKDNSKIWDKIDSLEAEKKNLERSVEIYKEYCKEKQKYIDLSERVDVINEYITDASVYFSKTITSKASEILYKLNQRYQQLYLDGDEYKVAVMNNETNTVDILSAAMLSSGEKTFVSISLILAVHELFFNTIPLMFDESFSALDSENIESLKKLFKNCDYQTFIITHDKTWLTIDKLSKV